MKIVYFCSSLTPLNDYWLLSELITNMDPREDTILTIDIYDLFQGHLREVESAIEKFNFSHTLETEEELWRFISTIDIDSLVIIGTSGGLIGEVREYLACKGIKVICDTTFGLPQLVNTNVFANKDQKYIVKLFRYLKYHGFLSGSIKLINRKFLKFFPLFKRNSNQELINRNTYLITSGSRSHYTFKMVRNAINHIKYRHKSSNERHLERVIKNDYVVFIDQALPYHRDSAKKGFDYSNYASQYYDSVSKFLIKFQEFHQIEVVIAIHPRSQSSLVYFKKFKCISGKTDALVKHCDTVLTHYSTCVYNAVYNLKPIIYIDNEFLRSHHHHPYLLTFSSLTGGEVIDADKYTSRPYAINTIVDINKYSRFIENYIIQSDSNKDLNIYEIIKYKFQ